MANVTINVHMDAKCLECGKGGAMDSGVCMSCLTKMIQGKPMKTERGRAAAARVRRSIEAKRQGG